MNIKSMPKGWVLLCALLCKAVCAAGLDPVADAQAQTSDSAATSGSANVENRWLQVTMASLGFRMRSVESNNGLLSALSAQHKEKFEGFFKFDKEGRYTLRTSVSSGYYFTRSYAETGLGDRWYGERGANLFVKQLYFQAEPIKGVQLQYGSLPIEHGSVSENISYDEDGYISGERLMIKRPQNFFFDEMSVTYAYIGDYYKPNMFNRLDRFQQSNYHQFLIAKHINKRLSLSSDLTHHGWSETVRVGAIADVHESKIFDEVRVGFYDRYSNESGTGFEANAQKRLWKRLTLAGGWVSVDQGTTDLITPYDLKQQRKASSLIPAPGGSLNADRFARGDSPWGSASYQLNPLFKISAFGSTDVDQRTRYSIKNSRIILLAVECDLLPALKKIGLN